MYNNFHVSFSLSLSDAFFIPPVSELDYKDYAWIDKLVTSDLHVIATHEVNEPLQLFLYYYNISWKMILSVISMCCWILLFDRSILINISII